MDSFQCTRAERAQALAELKAERRKKKPDMSRIRSLCSRAGIHVQEDEPQADVLAATEETDDGEGQDPATGTDEPQAGAGPESSDEDSAGQPAPGGQTDSEGGGGAGAGAPEPDAA